MNKLRLKKFFYLVSLVMSGLNVLGLLLNALSLNWEPAELLNVAEIIDGHSLNIKSPIIK